MTRTRIIDVEEVARSITSIQQVKRDTSGDVVFEDVASGLTTATTATGTTVTTGTTNVGDVSFTQCILKLNGAFTTAKGIINRDGSALATLTATTTATTTVVGTNLGLTGTHTWTFSLVMTAGTSATATGTVKKEARQTLQVRGR